ncbi:uncharacterized protein LOC126592641 isoform X3 [Malus sylvestris]|uniref:uncharacterized protein LOC126592641 isoform X3 n=1 Tax=Malus sylvestris TaxID=3752 RepID=UPI0021ABE62D|nr:uncharacterized protein LOC126592641 isoform X3 [Malus sylvestris]XP_050114353.1 uncharacterized protein LOC126592641 isoform X3 [Malus sylvestris]
MQCPIICPQVLAISRFGTSKAIKQGCNLQVQAMDVVEQDFTNLSDGASMEVTMGIQPDHGSENTEDTNTSSAKKKARVIKLDQLTLKASCEQFRIN